jgi:16S rRNA (adenine1518-N6/adenine1519-N6)-dimethyltransferase
MQMRPAPKKSLGQNFLRDGRARRRIVDACGFSPSDVVLEIGPGQGAVTPLIAERVKKLYAVELDTRLASELQERFAGTNVTVEKADILAFDPASIQESRSARIKVFGNIPYYITSPIIEHLFASRALIETVFLTVQKEFAERMCAEPGTKTYGSFSCFVRYYARPRILFRVKRNSFYPPPKVDSCFVRLDIREHPPVEVSDEQKLFSVIRHAFQQRRKTLRNSLEGIVSREQLESFFSCRQLAPGTRPERLSLEDFAALSEGTC